MPGLRCRNNPPRVRTAMTISSRAQLPARSPMPLMVHSTCRAPSRSAARLLATARPRSLWQWTLRTTLSMPRTCFFRWRMAAAYWLGHRVADGVGDVDRGGAGFDGLFDDLGEEIEFGAGGVFGRELDVVAHSPWRAGRLRRPGWTISSLAILQLELAMDGAGGEEDVDARLGGVLQGARPARSMSAGLQRARPQMIGPCDLARDRLHRLEIARRGDGEAGLDHVDAEVLEGVSHLELLAEVHAGAGRLLAVAQRGVEDDQAVGGGRGHETDSGNKTGPGTFWVPGPVSDSLSIKRSRRPWDSGEANQNKRQQSKARHTLYYRGQVAGLARGTCRFVRVRQRSPSAANESGGPKSLRFKGVSSPRPLAFVSFARIPPHSIVEYVTRAEQSRFWTQVIF